MPSHRDRRDMVKRHFTELGARWSTLYAPATPIGHGLTARLRCCADLLGDLTGKRLLDLGCGTGALVPLIRSTLLEYDGIDVAPTMVAAARDRLRTLDLGPQFRVREGDVESVPFPAESFDAVVALGLLGHVDDPGRVIREALRVARPDALLIVSTERLTSVNHLMVGAAWPARAAFRLLTRRKATIPPVLFYSDASIRALLEGAGCRILRERYYNKLVLPYPITRLWPRVASRGAALVEARPGFKSFATGYMVACAKVTSAGRPTVDRLDESSRLSRLAEESSRSGVAKGASRTMRRSLPAYNPIKPAWVTIELLDDAAADPRRRLYR
jgi:ubiquinone/menaquinone biosynthesis C-methylase UbiE